MHIRLYEGALAWTVRRIRHRSQRRCTSVAAGRSELWQRLSSDRGTAFNRPRDARSIRRAARAREKNCCSWPDPPPGEGGGSQPTRSLIACSNRTRERPSPGIRARADATLIFAALKCTRSPQAAGMFHLGDFLHEDRSIGVGPYSDAQGPKRAPRFSGVPTPDFAARFREQGDLRKGPCNRQNRLERRGPTQTGFQIRGRKLHRSSPITQNNTITLKNNNTLLPG